MNTKKTCLITGATSGIGEATTYEMIKRGYRMVVFARDSEKTQKALKKLRDASPSEEITWIPVDLASAESVKEACVQAKKDLDSLDILINNAGVYKRKLNISPDNLEMTIAVNYGAPFLISRLLVDLLKNGSDPTILNITSALYSKGTLPENFPFEYKKFKGDKAYSDSKLLIVMDTLSLARQFSDKGIRVNCAHPGVIASDVFREYPGWFTLLLNLFIGKPTTSGRIISELVASPEYINDSGNYFYKNVRKNIKNKESLFEKYESLVKQVYEFYQI